MRYVWEHPEIPSQVMSKLVQLGEKNKCVPESQLEVVMLEGDIDATKATEGR